MSKILDDLIQSQYNYNVAFYIHLKEFNQNVRDELEKRVSEVFFFSKGVNWKFDSFGIEKAGERKRPLNIPCQSNSDRRNPITPELKF